MYVDIPADTHDRLKMLAVERGMSQKGLVAELIEQACDSKPARKKSPRKVTKKRPTKRKLRSKKRGKKNRKKR
jgi:hypothetical protein